MGDTRSLDFSSCRRNLAVPMIRARALCFLVMPVSEASSDLQAQPADGLSVIQLLD